MQLFKNASKAFTLIELVLVISVGLTMSFLAFQKMISEHENTQAKLAGQQIKKIGESVNSYIVNHYDKLSTLSNSNGTAIDQGPRTCVTTTNTCSITIQTLINDGLLPTTYSGKNIYNSSYTINLKRTGTSPYYTISGLVLTTDSWLDTSTTIRYDLVGKAMQEAGIDSGTTRDSTSVVNGYNGNWHVDSTDFPSINKKGLLGYQVGFGSNSYSVFLRRDGTLPMTGNLNMGNNDINNINNINGNGNIIMGGSANFGGEVTAKNGYGDSITLGGDAAGNDFEIRLSGNKPLSIYSMAGTINDTSLKVAGNAQFNNRISTNGLNPNDLPTGWGGGVRTWDLYAVGAVATGSGGNMPTYMNSNGNIYASNAITSDGTVTAKGNINAGGWIMAKNGYGDTLSIGGDGAGNDYEIRLSTDKPLTIYSPNKASANSVVFQTYGAAALGGDTTLNGNLTSSGNITGKYIIPTNVLTVGSACSPNGLISRTAEGILLSCVNGVMVKQKYNFTPYNVLFTSTTAGTGNEYQIKNMGSHLFCFLSGEQNYSQPTTPAAKHVSVYLSASNEWILEQRVTQWGVGSNTWAQAICAD